MNKMGVFFSFMLGKFITDLLVEIKCLIKWLELWYVLNVYTVEDWLMNYVRVVYNISKADIRTECLANASTLNTK